jgi:NADPH2:quinone reductase
MDYSIRFTQTGGPEVLQWLPVGADNTPLKPNEACIRHHAVGVNYIDIYHRTGLYPLPLPSGIGLEGAGVVEAIGADVSDLQIGDRVAYAGGAPGAYAQVRKIAAHLLVKLPDAIDFNTGAAMMLQGLTAQYLLRRTYPVKAGDTILIHAAAGGVGLIVCQWAKALGCTVIGTVSTAEKAALAHSHGCDFTINYTSENFVERVKEITKGKGVPVVYDSIGKDTFIGSLDCLRPLGMMVSFGNASGPVPPFDLSELAKRGSLFITRPTLFSYVAKREDLVAMADELFEMVSSGKLKIEVSHTYPLQDAAQAHIDLAARKTTGSIILVP